VLGAGAGGSAQLFVDSRAKWLGIVETPEVEAADAVGLEGLAEFNGAGEDFVLMLEVGVGVGLVAPGIGTLLLYHW